MNTVTHIMLNALPEYDDSEVVTTRHDGKPFSHVFDDLWDFSEMEAGGAGKRHSVSFVGVNKNYRRFIQSTIAFIMEKHLTRYKAALKRSRVKAYMIELATIRRWLSSNDWSELSDDKFYKKFKEKLKRYVQEKKYSASYCTRISATLNKLNEVGLCDCVVNSTEFKSFSLKESKQHIAIPIGMYQPLIAKAVQVVETYHLHRFAISDAQRQAYAIEEYEASRQDVSNHKNPVDLRVAYRLKQITHTIPHYRVRRDGGSLMSMMTACAVVVLAFSGMRVSELRSLTKSSYEEKGLNRIPLLKGKESKRNGLSVKEVWQTHPITKDALELIYDATEYLRDKYKAKNQHALETEKISQFQYKAALQDINRAFLTLDASNQSSSYIMANMARMLNDYSKNSGVVANAQDVEEFDRLNPTRVGELKVGGALPKLSPHDLRRSFAVFFKRYGFGSSATIKLQYKHTNIQMSDYYSNNARLQAMEDVLLDNELLEIMNEEGIRMGVDIYDDIYNESEHLSGTEGERIAKDKFAKLNSGQHVYMTRKEIESLVRAGTLSAVKLPTGGYCTNPTCSRICGIGEFDAEVNPCSFKVVTDKEAKNILRQNKRLIQKFRTLNTGDTMMNSILIATKQKIKRNELIIKKHHLNFEEFNDKVQGVISMEAV